LRVQGQLLLAQGYQRLSSGEPRIAQAGIDGKFLPTRRLLHLLGLHDGAAL
jgi:hypothetical protein